ncbi:transporter substrate-binding domain-containing protein [Candidatus Halobeggiatoa sp. HSG11]|nr:transporter substrate-binding domain-containing protein [Candidatus Halobeggiatoa sp. HSG11]
MRILLIVLSMMTLPLHAQTLTIGVEDHDYWPYYTYKNFEYQGIARELLDKFAETKDYTFKYQALPVKRLFRDFLTDRVDFKFPDNVHWDGTLKKQKLKNKKQITYSDPVLRFIDGVMVLPENKGKNIDKFKKLGTILGFTPWAWLDILKTNKVRKIETPKYSNLISMALSKRIDGIYANIVVGSYQLEQIDKAGELVFDSTLPHSDNYYFLSSINYPQVIQEFNQFMRDNTELVNSLKNKYKVEEGLPK